MKPLTEDEIKRWVVNRQGKDFILYAGLLHCAHSRGLLSLEAHVVQPPLEGNDRTAICEATATFRPDGDDARLLTFKDIGDANDRNVGRMIALHIIRMASTRAKARCLRDALDVGYVAFEELGDADEGEVPSRGDAPKTPKAQPTQPVAKEAPKPASPIPANSPPGSGHQPCTQDQVKAIRDLSAKLHRDVPDDVAGLDYNTAADIIPRLSRELAAQSRGGR